MMYLLQLVESVLNKVVEEFEQRITSQIQLVSLLRLRYSNVIFGSHKWLFLESLPMGAHFSKHVFVGLCHLMPFDYISCSTKTEYIMASPPFWIWYHPLSSSMTLYLDNLPSEQSNNSKGLSSFLWEQVRSETFFSQHKGNASQFCKSLGNQS